MRSPEFFMGLRVCKCTWETDFISNWRTTFLAKDCIHSPMDISWMPRKTFPPTFSKVILLIFKKNKQKNKTSKQINRILSISSLSKYKMQLISISWPQRWAWHLWLSDQSDYHAFQMTVIDSEMGTLHKPWKTKTQF